MMQLVSELVRKKKDRFFMMCIIDCKEELSLLPSLSINRKKCIFFSHNFEKHLSIT